MKRKSGVSGNFTRSVHALPTFAMIGDALISSRLDHLNFAMISFMVSESLYGSFEVFIRHHLQGIPIAYVQVF